MTRVERRGGARPGAGRKPGPQVPKLPRVGLTPLQAAIVSLGQHNTPHFLHQLGFGLPMIHAAVRRGEIRWTTHGTLEIAS